MISNNTYQQIINKENKVNKSHNQDDSSLGTDRQQKGYKDEKLNQVLQIYIKNPQILIDEERQIKERFLAKQKKEIAAAKQKFETKSQHQHQQQENEDDNIQQKLKALNTPKDNVLNQLQKRKQQINTILADNSNLQHHSIQINATTPKVNQELRQNYDFAKKNLEYLEELKNQKERKKQEQEDEKKKKQLEQQRFKAENQLSQVQSKLFEQTELQKLRQKPKEELTDKSKRQANRSLSIENNAEEQQNINKKIIERQKEYLKKLKQQVQNEKESQYQLLKREEEDKVRIKNTVLLTIKSQLNEERRLTLDNHNLFLSKSTVTQSVKQISLPEINQAQTVCLNKQGNEVDKEKRKVATSQTFFRPASKKGSEGNENEELFKKSTTSLAKVKKLRPLPFINTMKEWKKKQRIPAESKIFIVMGGYKDFKKALLKRGWIENPQSNSACFDLKWTLLGKDIDYDNILPNQIVNHFEKNSHISSKIGLLNSLKNLTWFDTADANTFFPMCFDMNDPDEFNQFVQYFKLSKAESILKKYLRLYLEKDDKFNNYKLQAQVALQVLSRYYRNLDDIIDDENLVSQYFKPIPDEEWEILASDEMSNDDLVRKKHFEWIKKIKLAYQGIKVKAQVKKKKKKSQEMIKKMIQSEAIKRKENADKKDKRERNAEEDNQDDEVEEVEMDDFTSAVNQFLKEREECDPQFNLKGEDNIWIVKPAGLSRGRGITCYKNLVEIIDHAKSMELQMIVQKYIENPVLIKQRKFDIRIWVLIIDWNPLAIWYFDESYIRFSADNYSTKNLSNKFQHLTNNAISKKKSQTGEDEITLQGNMYTQEQLENFFIETEGYNVFQEKIKPKIMDIIRCSVLSCSDTVETRKNSMELFGYDIMIDTNYDPWLLEVNTSPSLEYSTDITKRLVKEVLEDVAKVVVDYGLAQKNGAKKSELSKISTGKFIKIYQGQEIQDKGINSLCKNFICEGVKMKVRKPKKSKKSTKVLKKQETGESFKDEKQVQNAAQQYQQQNNIQYQEISLEKKSRPQTAQSYKQNPSNA